MPGRLLLNFVALAGISDSSPAQRSASLDGSDFGRVLFQF
jgi:hypothetical protein